MSPAWKVAVIGDYRIGLRSHAATDEAIQHAAGALGIRVETSWLPTRSLPAADASEMLSSFDGFWAAPGGPYDSMTGALSAIRFARESGKPFIGT